MAKKCARTFSIVVEKGKKSILEVRHLLPVGIARSVWELGTASVTRLTTKPLVGGRNGGAAPRRPREPTRGAAPRVSRPQWT